MRLAQRAALPRPVRRLGCHRPRGLVARGLSRGGVYLAGGIPPKIAKLLAKDAASAIVGKLKGLIETVKGKTVFINASTSGTGGVMLIRVRDRASHTAYPSPSAVNRPDTRIYPDCPGPPGANGMIIVTGRLG